MAAVFSNNATSLLAVAINTSVTTVTVQTGDAAKFPTPTGGDWFPVTVIDGLGNMEIMRCTGRSGANLTVVRGQEGTTAQSFSIGARVDLRLTAAVLATFLPSASYTAADVLQKLLTVDGHTSGLNADKLDDQEGDYFLDLTNATGALPNANLPARIQHPGKLVTNLNNELETGWSRAANGATGNPVAADVCVFTQMYDSGGTGGRQMAFAYATATDADTSSWFRRRQGNAWGTWVRMRVTQDELDARYFRRGETTASNPNLNTLTTQGSYRIVATPTNMPAGAPAVGDWNLLIFGDNNTRTQLLASYSVGKFYIRGGYDPGGGTYTWETWVELLHTGNGASVANYRANSGGGALTAAAVWSAMAEVSITFASTLAWDLTSAFDYLCTLTGPATLGFPANPVVGKRGRIRFVQDATGGRTLSYASGFVFANGIVPVIDTTPSRETFIDYDVVATGKIRLASSPGTR